MKKILMKTMMISISEVMEKMFFLPVEPSRQSTPAQFEMDDEKIMACRLTFTGDASGCLILVAPMILVAEMAENFMGESRENLTDAHYSGTLMEMLNMVCGNALSKTEVNVPFELGIPEMIDPAAFSNNKMFTIIDTTQSKMAIRLEMD